MITRVAFRKRIARLHKEVTRREEASKFKVTQRFADPIVPITNSADELPPVNNATRYVFYINSNTLRVDISVSPTTGNLNMTSFRLLHPFITIENFGIHCFGVIDPLTKKVTGGFIGDRRKMFLEFLLGQDSTVTMCLLGDIKCEGALHLGVEPFKIKCNREVPRNRKDIKSNEIKDHQFDCVDILYQGQGMETVRVLGIIRQEKKTIVYSQKGKKIVNIISYVSLLVLRMVSVESSSGKQRLLRYSGVKSKGLDIDIVAIEAVVRPSMVRPIFTPDFPPNYKEKFSDIWANKGVHIWQFEHVVIIRHEELELFRNDEDMNEEEYINGINTEHADRILIYESDRDSSNEDSDTAEEKLDDDED